MATSKKKSQTKKSRKKSDSHISENWLRGTYINSDLAIPVVNARSRLANIEESDVRLIWDSLYGAFDEWKLEHGQVPIYRPGGLLSEALSLQDDKTRIKQAQPWECAGFGIKDPLRLLEYLEEIKYPAIIDIVSKNGKIQLLAVIILHEASIGDDIEIYGNGSPNVCADHIVAAINTERELSLYVTLEANADDKKMKESLLGEGRALGSQKNKEKSEIRVQALREAAIFKFKEAPASTYDDVIKWIRSTPSLNRHIIYGKGTIYSNRRIYQNISGTKDLALQALKK